MLCRYKLHETKRKCERIGSSAANCGKAPVARQGYLRSSRAGGGFTIFGAPMERSPEKRRRRCLKSEAPSGASMPSVEPAKKGVTENPSKRATCGRLFHRPVDLSAGGRSNRAELWGEISSRPRLAPVVCTGLELPKTRTSGPRTRRAGHCSLAKARLATYKKKRISREVASFSPMKAALCFSRYVAGRGPPTGKTPIQYSWDRHDRLSVISAITISPQRRRLGLYFQIHPKNIRYEQMVPFLGSLHRTLGRKFILVLDRYSVHRKAVRLLREKHPDWFSTEWLPAYAPELNPTEQVWNYSKYADLANFIPENLAHLSGELESSLWQQKHKPQLLRSYFEHAKLKL